MWEQWSGNCVPILADAAIKGTAVLTLAWLLVLCMRRTSAAPRHAVWLVAMACLLLLPLLSRMMPAWNVLPPWCNLRMETVAAVPEEVPPSEVADLGGDGLDRAAIPARPSASSVPPMRDLSINEHPTVKPEADSHESRPSPVHASSAVPTPPTRTRTEAETGAVASSRDVARTLLPWIATIWVGGAATVLAVVLLAWLSLWWIQRHGKRITDRRCVELLQRRARELGVRRNVLLIKSNRCSVPFVAGIFRPRLILPKEFFQWCPERREVVMLHELGHVARWDCLTKIIVQATCGLYWFNPLVWLGLKWIQTEAERACDDLVLRRGCDACDYAEHLLQIAAGRGKGGLAAAAGFSMARPSKLEGRLLAVLDSRRNRRSLTFLGAMFIVAVVTSAAMVIASVRADTDKVWQGEIELPPVKSEVQGERSDSKRRTDFGECARPETPVEATKVRDAADAKQDARSDSEEAMRPPSAFMQTLDAFSLIVQCPASDGMPVPCLSLQVAAGPDTTSRFRPLVQISREQAARIVDRLAADGFFVRARDFDAVGKIAPMSDACTIRIAADASQPKQVFVARFADKGEAIGQLRALHAALEGEAFKAMAKMIAWLDLSADSASSGDAVSRYWTEVNNNRDEGLFPPGTLHLLDSRGATVGPETEPTHGLARWFSDHRLWLAPPGYEIARVEYRLGGAPPLAAPGGAIPTAQIDIASLGNHHAELLSLFEIRIEDADGTWRDLKLDPGIRAVTTYVHRTDRWQMKFVLRPWVKPAAIPDAGVLYTRVVPEGADLYINGESKGRVGRGAGSGRIPPGSYEVEARWPDGRRRSVTRQVKQGEYRGVLLNADIAVVSREVVAASGSLPYLFTDRSGRIWLLWDQATSGVYSTAPRSQSDLFCATSDDGTGWSEPRRLPISSDNCDMSPVLQQDQHGTYWLMWISDRDPATPRGLWLASSQDSDQWSPPRKVKLPETTETEMARWQSSNYPRLAFAVDRQDVFWIAWQGWLIRSDDGTHWQVDSSLLATDKDKAGTRPGAPCLQLVSDPSGRLVLLTNQRGLISPAIWQRPTGDQWQLIGKLPQSPNSPFHGASVACGPGGALVGVSASGKGLFLRHFQQAETGAEPVFVEDYRTNPFHPTVAALPGGRFLLAFGSDEGLMATVFEKDRTTTALSNNGNEPTARQDEVRQ